MPKLFYSIVCAAAWLVIVNAQDVIYHDEPRELWRKTFSAIGQGNGVYLTPSSEKLVAVSRSGILRAYNPADGQVLWTFSPPLLGGGSVSCQGGITFVEKAGATYLAYMVIDTNQGEGQVSTCVTSDNRMTAQLSFVLTN